MSVNVLVMGQFKSGKSTFINALIGESVLPMRATLCTALVTVIEYGNDTERIKVFYKDSDIPVIVPRERYKFFIYPKEYEEMIDILNVIDGISHIEIQTLSPIFQGGLQIIDTPGLYSRDMFAELLDKEYVPKANLLDKEYVPKANVIIFMLDVTKLFSVFSAKENKYIKENFEGKHLQNVFFVVNRINQITEPLEESVIPSVKSGLSGVFTDENGRFDEELYQQRVFYVNAYGALCARTGEPYKVMVGRKEVEDPITIEETGFPKFETALWQYLRSSVGYGSE